jgi:hypothetical protein
MPILTKKVLNKPYAKNFKNGILCNSVCKNCLKKNFKIFFEGKKKKTELL